MGKISESDTAYKSMNKNQVLRDALLLTVFCYLSGCGAEPASTLRIGTNYWIGYEPLYLARELRYLDEKSFHLVEYPSSSEVIRAFRNQAIDVAALTLDETLVLAQYEHNPRIVLVTDTSNGGDAILGRPKIRTMKDLVGRRIAVERLGIGAYLLNRALDLEGLNLSDVELLHLEGAEAEEAFKQGKADAVVTCEPYLAKLVAAGNSVLFDSEDIAGEIVDVLAVREDLVHARNKQVETLFYEWFHALEYLRIHPQDAAAKMARRHQIDGPQVLQSLAGLKFPSLAENRAYLESRTSPLLQAGRRIGDMMAASGLIEEVVDVATLIEAAPIKALDMAP